MPKVKNSIHIFSKEDLGTYDMLWCFSTIEHKLKIGIITNNTRKILSPREIIGVNQKGKVKYLCILAPKGLNALQVKVALNKSRIRGLHPLILHWLASHGLSIYADDKLSPAGARVWKTLYDSGEAVTSSDSHIWSSQRTTIRIPSKGTRQYFTGVPYSERT
jgi:hypothetical protein